MGLAAGDGRSNNQSGEAPVAEVMSRNNLRMEDEVFTPVQIDTSTLRLDPSSPEKGRCDIFWADQTMEIVVSSE
jgi:hypothetical protein